MKENQTYLMKGEKDRQFDGDFNRMDGNGTGFSFPYWSSTSLYYGMYLDLLAKYQTVLNNQQ